MKQKNLYHIGTHAYHNNRMVCNCSDILNESMRKRGFRTNIWLTYNQIANRAQKYRFTGLSLVDNTPTQIRKMDYRTHQIVTTNLYNIDQTDFANHYPWKYVKLVVCTILSSIF